MTQHHSLGGLETTEIYFFSSGGRRADQSASRAVSGENLCLLHRRPFSWESSEGGREISGVSFRRSLIPSMRVPPKTNTLRIRFQYLNLGGTVSLQQQEIAI